MATRRNFFNDDAAVDDGYDALVGNQPLPTAPATPFAVGGGNQPTNTPDDPFVDLPGDVHPQQTEPHVGTGEGNGGTTTTPSPTPTPAPATATGTGPSQIPTLGGGNQVGFNIPWANGAPAFAPPGYKWDPNYGMFVADPTSTETPRDFLGLLLNHGINPQDAVGNFDAYGFGGYEQGGHSPAYYPAGAHGPGDRGTVGIPEGYYSLEADGSWKWNDRIPETGGGNGGAGSGFSLTPLSPQHVTAGTPVGTDAFSQLISGGLKDVIGNHGMTPQMQSVWDLLSGIVDEQGRNPQDDAIVQHQLESARESEGQAFTSQLADARAELASRGLVSEPGVGQGEEAGAIDRISRGLAPGYAGAVRDVNTASIQRQNDRITGAISGLTGLSTSASSNLLNALGEGTQRQVGLANLALDELGKNIQWNEFLAQFGLQRDQITYAIQNGQASSLLPLLAMFNQLFSSSTGGFV